MPTRIRWPAGYGQKDPLIEYKNEGYDMFLEMILTCAAT